MFFNIYKQVNFGDIKRVKSLVAEKKLDATKVMLRIASHELLKNSFENVTVSKFDDKISFNFSVDNYIVFFVKEIK
jgi:hypothetical protein